MTPQINGVAMVAMEALGHDRNVLLTVVTTGVGGNRRGAVAVAVASTVASMVKAKIWSLDSRPRLRSSHA